MIFRSNTEVRIAKALDHAGVFFLPPTKSRLNVGKLARAADRLSVFYDGQWGC
jgi:hypothetical protein